MMKWYVVQVLTANEKKVKKAIEDQMVQKGFSDEIEEILLPTEKVSEVKQGEQKIVEKKLWPGYLLIKMNLSDEAWVFVRNVNGVIEFLGGEKPTALTDDEVRGILEDLAAKRDKVVNRHQFEVGDHVRIVDGVFINFVGTVTDVQHEKGRISVIVSIFGRETQVDDLEFTQVERMSEEAV
jgi:transcriptional antiterminator NusG